MWNPSVDKIVASLGKITKQLAAYAITKTDESNHYTLLANTAEGEAARASRIVKNLNNILE